MTEPMQPLPPRRGAPLWAQILTLAGLIALLAMVWLILGKRQQGTVQPGALIPDFSLTLFNDYQFNGQSQVRLADFAGKVVVLNFWASWCKPCEQEAAELEAAWKFYEPRGDVIFLGVDYVDTEPEALLYLKKFGITYPNGPDLRTKISQLFRIRGVPETYFIDRAGVLRYVQVGPFTTLEQIQSIVDSILAE